MTKPLVPDQLLPPGVKDERQQAFVRALDSGLKTIDIQTFIMSDAGTVDAKLLPYLVREFSLQEFIEPGLKDEFVRNLIGSAYDLHAKKGYVEGTRLGLSLIGLEVQWAQWWQEEPKAHHDTHKVTVVFGENLFDDAVAGDTRHQSAVRRIVDATKRWSQSISIQFIVREMAKLGVGAFARAGGVVSHQRAPHPNQSIGFGHIVSSFAHVGGIVLHRRPALSNQSHQSSTILAGLARVGGTINHRGVTA